MSLPIVAIIGRPNVGKSTLFNKLIGYRKSIVDNTPGITRDRIYGECEWIGKKFSLIDTGGIEYPKDDIILTHIKDQAEIAITSANVIIFVVDVKSGIVSLDHEVANILRKSGKPVVLCVNKCDSINSDTQAYEFYNLGFSDIIAVSSIHGHGTGDLLDSVCKFLPEQKEEPEDDLIIKVAIIGKPNTGKSSLVNKIIGEERNIVSDIAGTTRDAIDTYFENEYGKFMLIDTAGIRRKSKVYENVEKFSVLRAKMAIERSDVCVIVVDALEGFTEQDSKVAGMAHESGKGCVIAINKWDAVEKDDKTMNEMHKNFKINFSFMSYANIIFISAKTGKNLNLLFENICVASNSNCMRISTGTINELLSHAIAKTQPPSDKGKRLKIYYMTQVSVSPPTFVCFVNNIKLFHYSYKRYIENQIRETFDLKGTPIRILSRERNESNW